MATQLRTIVKVYGREVGEGVAGSMPTEQRRPRGWTRLEQAARVNCASLTWGRRLAVMNDRGSKLRVA
jgi:hypothetical protein